MLRKKKATIRRRAHRLPSKSFRSAARTASRVGVPRENILGIFVYGNLQAANGIATPTNPRLGNL